MRKIISLAVAATMIIGLICFVSPVIGAEKMIEAKVTNITESVDRNGRPYVRMIIQEQRTLQGMQYTVGIPVMAFGDTVEKAKTVNIGDTIKAIVLEREFNTRQSYTVLAWL